MSIVEAAKAMIHDNHALMGRGIQYNNVCLEQESSPDLGGKDSQRGFHKCETIIQSFKDIWLSNIHPCAQGEEDEVRTFLKEG